MASVIDTYTKRVFTHNNKMSGETPPTGVKIQPHEKHTQV